jgi:hypothetical protein
MALGSTQSLTEMSTMNLPGGQRAPGAICEPIAYTMWDPHRLTTLWASMACYRDSFTFYLDMCMFRNETSSSTRGWVGLSI